MNSLLLNVIIIVFNTKNVHAQCQRKFRISEVEYDNPGNKDQDQFVEIYNGGIGVEQINDLHLVMYRSSDWEKVYHKDMNSKYTNSDGYYVQWLDEKLGLDSTLIALVCNNDFPSDLNVEGIIESEMDIIDVIIYEWNGNSLSQVVGNPLNIGLQFYVHQYPNNTATSISRCSCSTSANTSCFKSNTWPTPGAQNNCSQISSSNEVTPAYSTLAVTPSPWIPTFSDDTSTTYSSHTVSSHPVVQTSSNETNTTQSPPTVSSSSVIFTFLAEANTTYLPHNVSSSPVIPTFSHEANTTYSPHTVLRSSLVPASSSKVISTYSTSSSAPTIPSRIVSLVSNGTSPELVSLLPSTPVIPTISLSTSTSNSYNLTDLGETQETQLIPGQLSSSVSTTAELTDSTSFPSSASTDSNLFVTESSDSMEMMVSTESKGTAEITTPRQAFATTPTSSINHGLSSKDSDTTKSSTIPNEGYSSSSTETTKELSGFSSYVYRITSPIILPSTAPSAITTEDQSIEATVIGFSSVHHSSNMFSSPSQIFAGSSAISTLIAKISPTVGHSSSAETTIGNNLEESDTTESTVTLGESDNGNPSSAKSSVAPLEVVAEDSTKTTTPSGEEIFVGTSTADIALGTGRAMKQTAAYETSTTTAYGGLNPFSRRSSTTQPKRSTHTAPLSLDDRTPSSVSSTITKTGTSSIQLSVTTSQKGVHLPEELDSTHADSRTETTSTVRLPHFSSSITPFNTVVVLLHQTSLPDTKQYSTMWTAKNAGLSCTESRMISRNNSTPESTDSNSGGAPTYDPAHCGILCFETPGCGQYILNEEAGCFLQLNS